MNTIKCICMECQTAFQADYAISANKLYNERAFTVVEIFTKDDAP